MNEYRDTLKVITRVLPTTCRFSVAYMEMNSGAKGAAPRGCRVAGGETVRAVGTKSRYPGASYHVPVLNLKVPFSLPSLWNVELPVQLQLAGFYHATISILGLLVSPSALFR